MAKAVAHTAVTHVPFVERNTKIGYGLANKREIAKVLDQLEAVSPYADLEPTDMEDGLTYFKNGLRVYLWTSYVKRVDSTRIGWDSGKIIITENNRVSYYGPEIRRTGGFYDRLNHWALILKARVDNRPVCKHCGHMMSIYYSENYQYYWYCKGFYVDETHPWVSEQWDVGLKDLPEETLKFLKNKRERRRKYNKLRQKQGLPKHGTARERKKSWSKRHA